MQAFQNAIKKSREAAALARQREQAEMIRDMEEAQKKGAAYWAAWSWEAGCALRAIGIDVAEQPSADDLRTAFMSRK